MGFLERQIGLIMKCISIVSYSVLVNDEPQGFSQHSRGIRQGIFCPYLFLICSEGLNGLLQKAINRGDLKGFSLCKNGPQISHLFFANNSFILCRAKMGDIQTIQAISTLCAQFNRKEVAWHDFFSSERERVNFSIN